MLASLGSKQKSPLVHSEDVVWSCIVLYGSFGSWALPNAMTRLNLICLRKLKHVKSLFPVCTHGTHPSAQRHHIQPHGSLSDLGKSQIFQGFSGHQLHILYDAASHAIMMATVSDRPLN